MEREGAIHSKSSEAINMAVYASRQTGMQLAHELRRDLLIKCD